MSRDAYLTTTTTVQISPVHWNDDDDDDDDSVLSSRSVVKILVAYVCSCYKVTQLFHSTVCVHTTTITAMQFAIKTILYIASGFAMRQHIPNIVQCAACINQIAGANMK